jgi:hypothetical protein
MNDLIQVSIGDAVSWSNIEEMAKYAKSASGGNLNSSRRRTGNFLVIFRSPPIAAQPDWKILASKERKGD